MPILITVEGLGVPLALTQKSCTLLVMGTLLLGVPDTGMAQTVTPTFDDLRAESHHGETVSRHGPRGRDNERPRPQDLCELHRLDREERDPRVAGI